MAEVIGLTSGLLALISFAFGTSKSVFETVSSFRSRRDCIIAIQTDLESLVAVLTSIQGQAQDSSDISRFEPLRKPIYCCGTLCKEMREMLDLCVAHSTDKHDSVRDWLKMQYHEKSFDDMRKRLASYKSTLSIAFNCVNIQDQSISREALSNLKALTIGIKEDLEDQLNQIKQDISSATPAIRAIMQDDMDCLQTSLDALAHAQSIANTTLPSITIERNVGGRGSRTIFGTDTSQPRFELDVLDNHAAEGAVMSAGVYTPDTLQALLKNSHSTGVSLTLQALQLRPRDSQNRYMQSILESLSDGHVEAIPLSPSQESFRTETIASFNDADNKQASAA